MDKGKQRLRRISFLVFDIHCKIYVLIASNRGWGCSRVNVFLDYLIHDLKGPKIVNFL